MRQGSTGLFEKWVWNSRRQPVSITLGTQSTVTDVGKWDYSYEKDPASPSMKGNSGNVQKQDVAFGPTQQYQYDGLNRITRFQDGANNWQTIDADRYGNWWMTGNSGMPPAAQTPAASTAYNAATNRLTTVTYDDTTGNQVSYSPYTLAYDAENRLISATSLANGSASYRYDGEGRRVTESRCGSANSSTGCTMQTPGAITTVFVYDAMGNLAADYSSGWAQPDGLRFVTVDALGSTRLTTDASGGDIRRFDYSPYGELRTGNGRSTAPGYGRMRPSMQFTGKERDDSMTRLDYFGARYFGASQGRFTTPDPVNANILRVINPPRWNMYAYA